MTDQKKPAPPVEGAEEDKSEALLDLIHSIGQGDTSKTETSLVRLGASEQSNLFQQIGEMTRSLHSSLRDFQKNLASQSVTMKSTSIPDAASKLEAVIQMTLDATNKTLSSAEELDEMNCEARKKLITLEEKLSGCELPEGLQAELQEFFQYEHERMKRSSALTSTVIMAQEFQDLTGQSLRKVIKLVTELETNLVSLIKVFGMKELDPDELVEEQELETVNPDAALEQDDVDSLLNQFGF